MSVEDLGRILSKAKEFRTWLDALESRAKMLLLEGTAVPGMKLVHSSGRRAWREDTDVEALAEAHEIEEPYEAPKLVSPAQFEKLLTKGGYNPNERKEIMEGQTKTPSNQALVPETDKRPAIKNAIEQFEAIE